MCQQILESDCATSTERKYFFLFGDENSIDKHSHGKSARERNRSVAASTEKTGIAKVNIILTWQGKNALTKRKENPFPSFLNIARGETLHLILFLTFQCLQVSTLSATSFSFRMVRC